MENQLITTLTSELRRGTLILCVLSQLNEAKYGYALVQCLEDKGIAIDPNTLYPLLRRLEKQELLISEWELCDSKPRKYYRRTSFGDEIYQQLREHWETMYQSVEGLLKEGE